MRFAAADLLGLKREKFRPKHRVFLIQYVHVLEKDLACSVACRIFGGLNHPKRLQYSKTRQAHGFEDEALLSQGPP